MVTLTTRAPGASPSFPSYVTYKTVELFDQSVAASPEYFSAFFGARPISCDSGTFDTAPFRQSRIIADRSPDFKSSLRHAKSVEFGRKMPPGRGAQSFRVAILAL